MNVISFVRGEREMNKLKQVNKIALSVRANTITNIKNNVTRLYKEQWRQRDKQGKSVYNVVQSGKSTISTLELVAERANIPTWYLLLPITEELLEIDDLDDLVTLYINANKETRKAVMLLLKTLTSN